MYYTNDDGARNFCGSTPGEGDRISDRNRHGNTLRHIVNGRWLPLQIRQGRSRLGSAVVVWTRTGSRPSGAFEEAISSGSSWTPPSDRGIRALLS